MGRSSSRRISQVRKEVRGPGMEMARRVVRLAAPTPCQWLQLLHDQEGEGDPRDGIVLSADNVSSGCFTHFDPALVDGCWSSSAYTSLLRITTVLQKPSPLNQPHLPSPPPAVVGMDPLTPGLGSMPTAATPGFLRGLSSRNQNVAAVTTTGVEHPL